MKTIYINRHAKSSWKDNSLRDFDRPLNKRGKINGRFMADKFSEEEEVDLIISSPAVRARTTAKYFAEAAQIPKERVILDERIYGASVREMLKIINGIDNMYDSVILFGHNPTFSSLASFLDHNFRDYMVTCARVKIVFNVGLWEEISEDSGEVAYHDYPRKYPEMADL